MIMLKKSNRVITLILVALTFNVYSMKRAHEEERPWAKTVGNILLDEGNIQDVLQFTDLPPEILERIIYLLSANMAAQSLEDVAKNINTLALVDKNLNALINNPSFCLHLIKHLSQKFDCSNEEVAEALHTQEAKRRLELQEKLYDECGIKKFSIEILEKLLSEGADVNFTYYPVISEELLMDVYREGDARLPVIQWLVKHGANEDQQNHLLLYIIKYFCDYSNFLEYPIEIVKILLDAKADPEMSDENGRSILSLLEKALEEQQERYDAIIGHGNEIQYRRLVLSKDMDTLKTAIKLLKEAIQRKRKLGH